MNRKQSKIPNLNRPTKIVSNLQYQLRSRKPQNTPMAHKFVKEAIQTLSEGLNVKLISVKFTEHLGRQSHFQINVTGPDAHILERKI